MKVWSFNEHDDVKRLVASVVRSDEFADTAISHRRGRSQNYFLPPSMMAHHHPHPYSQTAGKRTEPVLISILARERERERIW